MVASPVGAEPSKPSGAPLILYCTYHKDENGNPRPYQVMGHRKVPIKIAGEWTEYEEPIYECAKCVFPDE
jgi:hypothetical protein